MTAALSDKDYVRAGIAAVVILFFTGAAAGAGGLPLPPFVALGGIIAFPWKDVLKLHKDPPWEAMLGALFIAWAALSWTWSPYDNPEQAIKLLVGVPLYAAFAFAIFRLEGKWRARAEAAFLFMAFFGALYLFAEFVNGGALTMSYKLDVEGLEAGDPVARFEVDRSLGHGVLLIVLFAGPAAALAWREGGPLIGLLLLALTGVTTFGFHIQVNILAFFAALGAAIVAYYSPRGALSGIFGLIAGAFVVTPLILPSLASLLPDSIMAYLPFSWETRIAIWEFAGEQIVQRPWLGWGLDASRSIDSVEVMRGLEHQLLPLHPHNAPIQVWLETGAFGSILLAFTLVMLGGRIAGARYLSRLQAAAISWVAMSYFCFIFFSYGAWQEWHMAALAVAIAGTSFLSARPRPA
ncbi:O-antigen ligase family protein [Hyphobacterium sp. HN65]|uniref:O-antigen ligase family protein n=1 Tax=Hyphobacterium lacteum TaxID=3116575 RepID=A0ABU7LPZ8_9PROT|nr:O-antigen ligase family protein [Hyphobacterium sp. HN65]MEE2525985.1 O-antigen ligase family protein [Hyphobacterium sp. HN65]